MTFDKWARYDNDLELEVVVKERGKKVWEESSKGKTMKTLGSEVNEKV